MPLPLEKPHMALDIQNDIEFPDHEIPELPNDNSGEYLESMND